MFYWLALFHIITYVSQCRCRSTLFTDIWHGRQLLKISVLPSGSAFDLDQSSISDDQNKVYISGASNADVYSLSANVGIFEKRTHFGGSRELHIDYYGISVHLFNYEVEETSKSIHFLCHATLNTVKALESVRSARFTMFTCCFISVNTSFSHEFASCALHFSKNDTSTICHTSVKLPSVLWKQAAPPVVVLSYATSSSMNHLNPSHENNPNNLLDLCSSPPSDTKLIFTSLPSVTISRSVPDAIRELGGFLLLQIPRRELRSDEEFIVPVRLKQSDDITDFTLRCEVPANSYVEFVRVIWPGGLTTWKHADLGQVPSTADLSSTHHTGTEHGIPNLWDVFHRSMVSQKRNITEIVARLREDLIKTYSSRHGQATEVYKLLFRVNRPPVGASDRVAPRIFWSLVSLGRHNSPDRSINVSPMVTRLNIESSELRHLAMVMKTSALVNLAALTGIPSVHPVWVYGLTHKGEVIDVTHRATCHTGDDAIIHFANDACFRLGFSGAELDGSPGLPLVAKLDGRSATVTLVIWFPKPPALRITAGQSSNAPTSGDQQHVPQTVVLKRLVTGVERVSTSESDAFADPESAQGRRNNVSNSVMPHFQLVPIRVLARFILAGSVLYDKDVLGGKVDQYVDVTDYVAHRLRVVRMDAGSRDATELHDNTHRLAANLLMLTHDHSKVGEPDRENTDSLKPTDTSTDVWLTGRHAGHVRVGLEPIDRSALMASIPPGLDKQLKDQKLQTENENTPQATSNFEEQPELYVQVTDESSVWPVGMSAQLITDISLSVNHCIDGNSQPDSNHTRDAFPFHSEDSTPIYSILYAIHVELLGGRLVHSGTVPDTFTGVPNDDGRLCVPLHKFTDVMPSRSSPLANTNGTSLLVVWIHLSDGTTILWNRLTEAYQATKQQLPFRLSINNLRNDLLKIVRFVHQNELKLKRSVRSIAKPHPTYAYKWSHFMNSVSISDMPQADEERPVRVDVQENEWSGLAFQTIRFGTPFTGDILELNLLSTDGRPLLPAIKVPGRIDETAPGVQDHDRIPPAQLAGSYERDSNEASSNNHLTNSQTRLPKQTQLPSPVSHGIYFSPLPYEQTETDLVKHGMSVLKDAPKMRTHPINISPVNSRANHPSDENHDEIFLHGAQDESSLSDQIREEKVSSTIAHQSGQHTETLSAGEGSHGSRSVLEMSMYVLLGLFALVGLVFAVNCGAVVARYRWERAGRQRTHSTSELTIPRMVASDLQATSDTSKSVPQETTKTNMREANGSNKMRKYAGLLMQGRTKHKPLLHKDDNWVWISRDNAAGSVRTDGPRDNTSQAASQAYSPLISGVGTLGKEATNRTFNRSHFSTTQPTGTRAVLSIGEADMLLLHSPYHRSMWQDGIRTDKMEAITRSPTHPEEAHTINSEFDPTNPWKSMDAENDTHLAGRLLRHPMRRHTTTALTQRNYQGQECSIRIISNPISEQSATPESHFQSHAQEVDAVTNETNKNRSSATTLQPPDDFNRLLMGSASVSMHRRQRYNLTYWDPELIRPYLHLAGPTGGSPLPVLVPPMTYTVAPVSTDQGCSNCNGDRYWEAVMYRSWVRPGANNLQTQPSLIVGTTGSGHHTHLTPEQIQLVRQHLMSLGSQGVDNGTYNEEITFNPNAHHPESCQRTISNTMEYLDEADHCNKKQTANVNQMEPDSTQAPYPPVRTTSQMMTHHTLKTREKSTKHSHALPSQRPLSLPQNFHATNELYSALTQQADSTERSTLVDSHSQMKSTSQVQQGLNSSPSEESLWWYHPIRQHRRVRRQGEIVGRPNTSIVPPTRTLENQCVNTITSPFLPDPGIASEAVEYSSAPDYACPASHKCEIVNQSHVLVPALMRPDQLIGSTVTTSSELAWDQDLLALSHDRLVAYFADMKESVA